MKHHTTQALFNYWTRKRGRRRAPVRSDIDPADIRRILADTFILTADFVNEIRVRLAGTRVCALFAREIKGETFDDLWSEASREQVHDLVTAVVDENAGVVAGVLGRTEQGAEIELELLLLPLAFDGERACVQLARWLPRRPDSAWHQTADGARFGHLQASWNCQRYTSGRPARSLACGTAFASTAGASIAHRSARRLTHH